jgi:hypothetical protein
MARGDSERPAGPRARLTDEDRKLAKNIGVAKQLLGLTNRDIAVGLGLGDSDSARNWVQERASGKQPLTHGQVCEWSIVLRIPVEVLTSAPQNILDYVNAHPELVPGVVGCMPVSAVHAA